jgi:hypothetical protein
VLTAKRLEPGDALEVPSFPFVVKPAVSCCAKVTARYHNVDWAKPQDCVRRLHTGGRTVMIQPYLSKIEVVGETSLMFIGGQYSHSIRRDSILRHTGFPEDAVPPSNVRACNPMPDNSCLPIK